MNVGVFQVLTGWGETSLTYNKSNTSGVLSSTAESVSTLVAGSNITQTSPRIKSFNVSNIVKNWYAGESNYGVGLTRVGGQNSVILCSREGSAEYRPSLTITYTLPTLSIVTGNYYVQNSSYETYLTVYEEALSNYDELFKIEIRKFHGGVTQKWHFTYLHNGYYKITSCETGRALSVQSGKEDESDSDSILKQEVYTASARQQWKITLTSNGNYKIAPKSAEDYTADYCMAGSDSVVSGVGTSAIRNIEQGTYDNNTDYKDEWNLFCISGNDTFLLGITSDNHDHFSVYGSIFKYLVDLGYESFNPCSVSYMSVETCLMNISESKLIVTRSHGGCDTEGTFICLSDTSIGSYLGTSEIYNFQTNQAQVDFSNVEIILFIGCNTAYHENTSLTDAAVAAGAQYAIGFIESINCTGANKFVESFFSYLNLGNSVEDAVRNAASDNLRYSGISSYVVDINH